MPPVKYVCDEGFTLDSSPGGLAEFEVTCLHTGQFSEGESCNPVLCGKAPAVSNCSYEEDQEFVFMDKAGYECDEGFSVDGDAGGSKTFEAECQADASFA